MSITGGRNLIKLLQQSVTSAAQLRPESIAFRCGDQEISYGQLDEKSSRLAKFLIRQGAKKRDRIGVFMPRCVETSEAVYGILKAGCIFVPIDSNLSAGGVATLVNDCGIRHLLTHQKKSYVLAKLVRKSTTLECLIGVSATFEVGSIRVFPWNAFSNEDVLSQTGSMRPEDPAYIMYSSGSTGQPKGITHTHFSGLSYSQLSIETYNVTSADVIANHSPINFDMSTFGYFTSCLAGATTVLIPTAYTAFPSSLAKLIEDERITIWYSVPLALIQLLLRTSLDQYDLSTIRWVKFGGEPFPPKHLRALMRAWPHARFSNVYGPAEVNQCTFYHVPPTYAKDPNNLPIPIGEVWNETFGLILDQDDQIILNGKVGELLISSPTMMHGYWGRPERTNSSLWQLNEGDGKIRVYYKTGDLVKRTTDGNLMFIGRKDRQVKIRGYRIELDEIENAFNSLPDIEEAGVFCVVIGDTKEIRAAAILKDGAKTDSEQIKLLLSDQLSQYAIPASIQLVEKFPRTTSGKIDRNQLKKEAEGILP